MRLVPEIGVSNLVKYGEELCGDSVEIAFTADSTIIVLSDGLGSGVKANILSTLTTKIASKMLVRGTALPDVVTTIAETLPICRVRGIAYSTFTIIQIFSSGSVYLVEFDSPPAISIKGEECKIVPTISREIAQRTIRESRFELGEGEMLVVVSDGVTHAGIGGLLPLGLGIEGLIANIKKHINFKAKPEIITKQITGLCEAFYLSEPGDDTTSIVIKMRKPKIVSCLTGPPLDQVKDPHIVKEFISTSGSKIVCGGTTANIVARELNRKLEVDFSYQDQGLPPTGRIEGIDLVTEGILTLTKAIDILEQGVKPHPKAQDGANLLISHLLDGDEINFFVGTRVNPAHQNPALPIRLSLRKNLMERMVKSLEKQGKKVNVRWY